MKKERTAFFTGHRKINEELYPKIGKIVRKIIICLIERDVIYFGNGGALGFDLFTANIVLELRKIYPQIKLIMVLPCETQTKLWKEEDILSYNKVLNQADKLVYVSKDYTPRCMLDRNDHMIKHSNYCIAYVTKKTGGSAYTITLAEKESLKIINVADII